MHILLKMDYTEVIQIEAFQQSKRSRADLGKVKHEVEDVVTEWHIIVVV